MAALCLARGRHSHFICMFLIEFLNKALDIGKNFGYTGRENNEEA